MANQGETVRFATIGGKTVIFVYEGDPYGYGEMTCGGCKQDGRMKVGEANDHAGLCRAM